MAEPLVIQFAADTSRATSAMSSLAASIAGNMASIGVAMSGGAANSNNFGGALANLQQNATRAATAIGTDVRNIATATANAATKEKATLEGVVRSFTAAAAGSQTAQATVQAGLAGTTSAISIVAAQIPTLQTLLRAFIAFEAAKLVFFSVAASIDQAREHIADFVKIGKDAERAGVGAEFFQRATLAADKYGLTVEQVTQALNKAREASDLQIGEGKGGKTSSDFSDRLEQNVRAGNLTAADRAAFDNARDQEARIRVVLDLIDKLRAGARDVAAFDLAGKFFGPEAERQLRNGVDLTNQLREAINSTSTTVAGVRIVGEDEVERARQLDAKAKEIANTFATALAPIQRDISNAVLDTYQAFLNVEAVVARIVQVAVNLYTQITGIVGKLKEAVNSIPGVGKILTAGNPVTFLQEVGRAVGVISPEEQGPPAPVAVRIRPRGNARAAPLPSLSRGGGGSESSELDAVEQLINQIERARDTAQAELANVGKSNVEREKAVALAKAEAAAREDVKRGKRDRPELDDDERARVLGAAEAMQRYKDSTLDAQQALRQAAEATRYFGEMAAAGLADAILEGRSLNDILNNLTKQLARSALQALFTGRGPLAGILGTATKASEGSDAVGGLFGGLTSFFRANGGPVEAGRAYTVGERGRELFIPNRNGQIVPIVRGGGSGSPQSISMGNTYLTMTPAAGVTPGQLQAVLAARDAENRRTIGQQLAAWRENN